jgi:predicted RNase H-like HicB family nuclease
MTGHGYDFGDTRTTRRVTVAAGCECAKALLLRRTPRCSAVGLEQLRLSVQARSRRRPDPLVIDCGSKQTSQVSATMSKTTFTAILEREGDVYVALCPELDIASQGGTIEEATVNLREAVALFLETADSREITQRLRSGVFVTTFDVVDG